MQSFCQHPHNQKVEGKGYKIPIGNLYNAEEACWNLLTGSKNVTVETQAEVQFDQSNLKQIQINVHHVMPLRMKQKTKEDIQIPNPNQNACISSITASLFPRSPYFSFSFFGKQKIERGRQPV